MKSLILIIFTMLLSSCEDKLTAEGTTTPKVANQATLTTTMTNGVGDTTKAISGDTTTVIYQ